MNDDHLKEERALELVDGYMKREGKVSTTQEIMDSGVIPALKGFTVRTGKVSDSIYGGKVKFTKKDGAVVDAENPRLVTRDGRSLRLMIRTQRISTHDINRGEIPFKDQILAANHNYMKRLVEPAIGTSQFEAPGLEDNDVVIAARYVIGIQELLGKRFEPNMRPRDERVVRGLQKIVENLAAR